MTENLASDSDFFRRIDDEAKAEAAGAPKADDADNSNPSTGRGPSQRDKLISIADGAEYWCCPDGIAHVTFPVGGHREHYRVRSPRFRNWLLIEAGRAFPAEIAGRMRPGTFGKNAVEDALSSCEAMAAASEKIMAAPLRVAESAGSFYIDTGDPEWRAIEISPSGWRIIDAAPVPILRTRRTRALLSPTPGGSLEMLRALLPISNGSEDEWRLIVLWLLAASRPTGPYPILALSGEQGSGKSVTARMLRRLVDPSGGDILQPPREDRDLIAAARGNHVLAFDNISAVSGELADSLCRLATGGDIGGRMLYTDNDSAAFSAVRPVIVNGIPDLVTRGDLSSRALFVRLMPMQHRRTEAELWAEFDDAAPAILGGLLDILSSALRKLPDLRLPEDATNIRMADLALLAMAAEPALGWPIGSALGALRGTARNAGAMIADLDPVALAVRGLVEREHSYKGLVSCLYAKLVEMADLDTRRAPRWPKHAARFGEDLRRVAPALRSVGISVAESRSKAGMIIEIRRDGAGVGEAPSLSLSGEHEEGSRVSATKGNEAGTEPKSPTPPTPPAESGGDQPFCEDKAGVGGVGGVGGTYTEIAELAQEDEAKGVGGVGDLAREFIPPLPLRRSVRI